METQQFYTIANLGDETVSTDLLGKVRVEMAHALDEKRAIHNLKWDGPRWFEPPEVDSRFYGLMAIGESN